jgi:hypothetical protein
MAALVVKNVASACYAEQKNAHTRRIKGGGCVLLLVDLNFTK